MENHKLSRRSGKLFGYAAFGMALAGGAIASAQAPEPHPAPVQDNSTVAGERVFLKTYCVTCHSDKLHTAGLSLESVNLTDVARSGEALEKVVLKLGSGAMPPASARRPDKATANAFLASLETSLDGAATARPNPGRPMMLHRLNRTEYLDSVRDLFDVQLESGRRVAAPAR